MKKKVNWDNKIIFDGFLGLRLKYVFKIISWIVVDCIKYDGFSR